MIFKPNTIINPHLFKRGFKIFCTLFLTLFSLSAQNQPINIAKSQVSIKTVFQTIEEQTGLSIGYNEDLLNVDKTVSVNFTNRPLSTVLDNILKGTGTTYQIEDNLILIIKVEQVKVPLQEDTIKYTGIVLDDANEPVIGASVAIKNTTNGTITDINGRFELTASKGSTLSVNYLGYVGQEVKLGDKNRLDFFLSQDSQLLDDVVVIGYGVQRKRDVSTSISSINAAELGDIAATTVEQALVGRMAGVQITQANAAPGAGLDIKVRGVGTITAGSSPLYVIDGVPMDDNAGSTVGFTTSPLASISMGDIESIEILKDASASAIYGSRGSNGVVIVTTKSGASGKPVIQYSGHAGMQTITSKLDVLNAYEYAELVYDGHNAAYYEQLRNKGLLDKYNPRATNQERWDNLSSGNINLNQTYMIPDNIWQYVDGVEGLTNTDWQDEVLRTGFIHKHNLSISGGTSNIRYFISGNYQKEEGIVINSDFEKMGFRTKIDVDYNKWKIGGNISLNRNVYNLVNSEGRYARDGVLSAALGAAPLYPVYNDDGSYNFDHYNLKYGQSIINNPVALASEIDHNIQALQMLATGYVQYEFIDGLSFRSQGSWNYNNNLLEYYRPASLPNSSNPTPPSNPEANSRTNNRFTWTWENTMNYRKKINKDHTISGLGGWTVQKFRGHSTQMTANDLPQNDMLHTIPTTGTATYISSSSDEWSLLSALARVQYNFMDKYMLSAAIRYDGSSRFGANNKWGSFPSVSGAWYVTEEDFMQPVTPIISNLKLRASWGVTGNMNIGNYSTYGTISGDNYVFGGNSSIGMAETSFGSPDIGWEKTSQVNLGLEMELFKWLNIEMDIYKGTTSDMLLQVPVLNYSGFTSVLQNIGKLSNKGIELTLSTNHKIGKVQWRNSINYAANRNKVLSLGDGVDEMISTSNSVIDFITKVGEPIGNYYTYVVDGVYQNQAEIDRDVENGLIVPNARPGDFRFKKFGNDDTIDANDKAITGNYLPDFTYGFSTTLQYEDFDFSLALQGVQGNEIANINSRYLANMEGNANQLGIARDRWRSEENPGNGSLYRANRSATGMNSVISTHHIENGSYMRIREITLGYSLPKHILQRAGMSSLRIYVSAFNPFTFTKYSGYNPEVSTDGNPVHQGVDYGTYPMAKSFVFGLNFTL